jgi:GTP-dependent phosphoenolpyruvate carboxykinase
MSKFTVRVELCDSTDADYEELHEKMEEKGFSRKIKPSKSVKKKMLPNAEYNYVSATKSKFQVGDLALSIAEKVTPNPKILVTKSAGRYVINLDDA